MPPDRRHDPDEAPDETPGELPAAAPGTHAPATPAGTHAPATATGTHSHLGRHIAGARPGLRWTLGWTLAGTLLPGAGLVAAGHRRGGSALLATGLLIPATVGAALWRRSSDGGLATLGDDPRALAIGAAIALGGGALLAGVAFATNQALLRRARPGRLRRITNLLVTGVLVGAVLGGAWLGGTVLLDRRAAVLDAGDHG
jgi:polyisoprenyl-teichoic acid--peptidoglycan teichoic acid transferase